MNEWLTWLLDHIAGFNPALRIVLAGVAIMLETSVLVGLVVPGDSVVLVASTAVRGWAEWGWTILAVITGALAGESIGFWLGRWCGPYIRRSWVGRRIGERQWQRAETYLDRRGGWAVFLSRFLPVLHSVVPMTVGMSAMKYRTFIAWTSAACTIWALIYVTVGWRAAASYRDLSQRLNGAALIFVGIIVVFGVAVWAVKTLIARSQERHMHSADDASAAGDHETQPNQTPPVIRRAPVNQAPE